MMFGKLNYLVSFLFVLALAHSALSIDDPSLVIHYSFDNVGKVVTDLSGKGHNGTVQGEVAAEPGGRHGGAANFANGGFLDLNGPGFPAEDIPISAMTIAAWVKCENTGEHHAIFDARTDAGTWITHPELRDDGQLRWMLRAYGMSPIFDLYGGSITWDEWLHYAGTYDKEVGKAILYVNGHVVSEVDIPSGMEIAGDWDDGARVGLNIGGQRPFIGLMDDFHLFKRALSRSELKKMMYGEGWPYASNPSPADGALHSGTWVRIDWSPGDSAISHDVYFGENFNDVNDGIESTFYGNQTTTFFIAGLPGFVYPEGLVPGEMYYWRIDEIETSGMIHEGDVWSFWIPSNTAYNPEPADGAKFIDPNVELRWEAGLGAKLHTVYFGENFDDVNNAMGGFSQSDTTYRLGTLETNKTYYWRIDEMSVYGMYKGNVWCFTTTGAEGGVRANYFRGVDLGNQVLTRTDPQINFNWGLTGPDEAVGRDNFSVRWTGELDVPISETYSFYPTTQGGVRLWVSDHLVIDKWRVDALDERWQDHFPVEYHRALDLEAGKHPIVMEFTYTQSFGGGAIVRLAWGSPSMSKQTIPQAALSLPFKATRPSPFNHAVDVRQTATLGWSPGYHAASHHVYFGMDEEAVRNADTNSPEYQTSVTLGSEGYDPGELAWNTTYYWRVDEVNSLHPESPWVGRIWSFTTADFLIVDDFELYNDFDTDNPESNRIFDTWIDGYGTTTNGSVVGHENPNWTAGEHFVETQVVHGGGQSMPYFYNNNFKYSEAVLSLSPPHDWTEHDLTTLSLWFHGDSANTPERMYVAVNDTMVYHDNSNVTKINTWTEWTIDLQTFAGLGVDLTRVNAIAIGFGDKNNLQSGGTGKMFFDDIRVCKPSPSEVTNSQ